MFDENFYQRLGSRLQNWKDAYENLNLLVVPDSPNRPFSLKSQAEIESWLAACAKHDKAKTVFSRQLDAVKSEIANIEYNIQCMIPVELWGFDIICNGLRVRVSGHQNDSGSDLYIGREGV